MKKDDAETAGPSMEGSAEALAEVLARARQALANLYHARNSPCNNQAKIKRLSNENELLKKELSELEKMIREKL